MGFIYPTLGKGFFSHTYCMELETYGKIGFKKKKKIAIEMVW